MFTFSKYFLQLIFQNKFLSKIQNNSRK